MLNRITVKQKDKLAFGRCLLCSGHLVLRHKKDNIGLSFLGCSRYPDCSYFLSLFDWELKVIEEMKIQEKYGDSIPPPEAMKQMENLIDDILSIPNANNDLI